MNRMNLNHINHWFRSRALGWRYWLVILFATLLSGMLAQRWQQQKINDEYLRLQNHSQQDLQLSRLNLQRLFLQLEGIPRVIAELDISRQAQRSPAQAQTLNHYLASFAREFSLDLLWVMDIQGNVIASSDYAEKSGLLGKNLSDRLYFQQAVAGHPARQFAVGRKKGQPGLYFSYPIQGPWGIMGVIVAKQSLHDISEQITTHHTLVSDEHGVVIMATEPEFIYRTLPNSNVSQLSPDARQQHYQRESFQPLPLQLVAASYGLYDLSGPDNPILLQHLDATTEGFTLHGLQDASNLMWLLSHRSTIILLFSLLGCAISWALLLSHLDWSRQREHRRYMAETNNQLQALNNQLEQMAYTDPLTGCANRRQMELTLPRLIHKARILQQSLSLILIDIDHFKRVNDQFGHDAGDRVLQHLSGILQQRLRSGDLLVRLGGEEFLIILPTAKESEARHVAEACRELIGQHPLLEPNLRIDLTISAGIACYQGQEVLSQLLKRADEALYLAKSQGRNRVILSPSLESAGR